MSSYRYSPRELPDLRMRMSEFQDTHTGKDWARMVLEHEAGQPLTGANLDHHRDAIRHGIDNSELFFLDRYLTAIIQNTPFPIGDYGFMPWDLPAPCGFIYFDADERDPDVDDQRERLVLTWIADDPRPDAPHGVLYIFIHHLRETLGEDTIAAVTSTYVPDFVFVSYLSVNFSPEPDGVRAFSQDERAPMYGGLLMAACHLMRQKLAEPHTEAPDRSTKRRHQRAGLEPPQVRTVSLKQSARPEATGDSERVWAHKWVVRGHWRRQPYPSLGIVRPIWIAPFVKGPEDAPLLGGEKVYTLTDPA